MRNARAVPPDNVCAMPLPIAESVSRDVYDTQIDQPIWHCIATRQAHDRILYIVLTKDVPLRISGTSGRSGTGASVDSELTLLYRRRTDVRRADSSASCRIRITPPTRRHAVEAFSHRTHDIYLVTRLDGYTRPGRARPDRSRRSAAPADGVFVLGREPRLPTSCQTAGSARRPSGCRPGPRRRVVADTYEADRRRVACPGLLLLGLERRRRAGPGV